jgi:hypothetical protein
MAKIIDLDFEDGAALTAPTWQDVIDISNQSGQGLGGSTYGVRGNPGGTASQKYYGEAYLQFGSNTSKNFKFQADFDHADSAYSGFGYSMFEMFSYATSYSFNTLGDMFSLYHGVGSGSNRDLLEIYLPAEPTGYSSPVWTSDAGTIIPGTKQTVMVCGKLSTFTGGTLNADAEVSVYVNGVLQTHLTGRKIAAPFTFGADSFKVLHVNPMGKMDNLIVYDAGCVVTVTNNFSNDGCCADTPSGSGGGGGGGGSDPGEAGNQQDPDPAVFQNDPELSCVGGGVYLSAADPTPSETWS